MEKDKATSEVEIQDLLVEALEIQLASFKVGMEFWTEWAEHVAKSTEAAVKRIDNLKLNSNNSGQLLLEMTDISRETLRVMTSIPRRSAERFIAELDARQSAQTSSQKGTQKSKRSRSVRAKP